MTVAKFSIAQKRSMSFECLLLLLSLVTPVLSADYPSVYIPIGVGQSQKDRNLSTPFGAYGSMFNFCGKYTSDQLNEQFPLNQIPASHEYVIQCNPSPTRVIVSAAGKFNFGTFPKDLKKECELFTCSDDDYESKGTDLGSISNGGPGSKAVAGKPEDPEFNVCMNKKAGYSDGASGNVLFANEDNCREAYPDLDRSISVSNKFVQLPRWLKKDESRFNLRTMMYKGENRQHHFRVPYGGYINIAKTANTTYKPCDTACDKGQLVKLIMNPGAYRAMIYLKARCSNFQICLNPTDFDNDQEIPKCHPDKRIDVMVAAGAVMFNNKGRAELIELKSPYHQDSHAVPIEFGYGVASPSDPNNISSEFYIGNDHREFVMSDTGGFQQADASKLAFFFSDAKCLVETAGIFSKNIQNGKTWTSEPVKLVGKVYNANGTSITGPQNKPAYVPPVKEEQKNIPKSTTPDPISIIPAAVGGLLDTNINSAGAYVTGKWWIWGVFFGFVTGTLLTLFLGAAIFYLIRRTVFGIWYRGMYKRYGCDVSGTTGGLTGVGFGTTMTGTQTVGGVTGATTVGATTGGETGAGKTASSTTATEANSSTSMLDSNKTLGM